MAIDVTGIATSRVGTLETTPPRRARHLWCRCRSSMIWIGLSPREPHAVGVGFQDGAPQRGDDARRRHHHRRQQDCQQRLSLRASQPKPLHAHTQPSNIVTTVKADHQGRRRRCATLHPAVCPPSYARMQSPLVSAIRVLPPTMAADPPMGVTNSAMGMVDPASRSPEKPCQRPLPRAQPLLLVAASSPLRPWGHRSGAGSVRPHRSRQDPRGPLLDT
jgi:hypothetical protein